MEITGEAAETSDIEQVLNKAREVPHTETSLWIIAAKLAEANRNTSMVARIMDTAIQTLQRENVSIDREVWMKAAEATERTGSVTTCRAIINSTIGIGVAEQDRKRTWLTDAEDCKNCGSVETARAIYAHALTCFPGKKSVWLKAAQLEKSYGTQESLDAMLEKAVECCPQAEVLWLMGAMEKWLAGDVPSARAILLEAHAANPGSEEIWLAALRMGFEDQEPGRALLFMIPNYCEFNRLVPLWRRTQ